MRCPCFWICKELFLFHSHPENHFPGFPTAFPAVFPQFFPPCSPAVCRVVCLVYCCHCCCTWVVADWDYLATELGVRLQPKWSANQCPHLGHQQRGWRPSTFSPLGGISPPTKYKAVKAHKKQPAQKSFRQSSSRKRGKNCLKISRNSRD